LNGPPRGYRVGARRVVCGGLQRMVEDDKYCIDIHTQVPAVTRPLPPLAQQPE
jgi:hypothetical protein